jgi:hypothetical protein
VLREKEIQSVQQFASEGHFECDPFAKPATQVRSDAVPLLG